MPDRPALSPHVQKLIEGTRRVQARLAKHQAIIDQRGGLPDNPRRTIEQRMRELKWQLQTFALLTQWDRELAKDVIAGTAYLHPSVMVMQQELGIYGEPGGDDLYIVDCFYQRILHPTMTMPTQF